MTHKEIIEELKAKLAEVEARVEEEKPKPVSYDLMREKDKEIERLRESNESLNKALEKRCERMAELETMVDKCIQERDRFREWLACAGVTESVLEDIKSGRQTLKLII